MHTLVNILACISTVCVCVAQVRAYCESQPRYKGRSWMELFPDDAFPNDTPEDKAKSNSDSTFVHVCILLVAYSRMTIPGYDYHDFIAT